MADDPDAIQRDIERTRADLAGTLAAIVDRVSPKKVANRSTERAKDAVREQAQRATALLRSPAAAGGPPELRLDRVAMVTGVLAAAVALLTWSRRHSRRDE